MVERLISSHAVRQLLNLVTWANIIIIFLLLARGPFKNSLLVITILPLFFMFLVFWHEVCRILALQPAFPCIGRVLAMGSQEVPWACIIDTYFDS